MRLKLLFILLVCSSIISCDIINSSNSDRLTQEEFVYFVSQGEKTPGLQVFRYSVKYDKVQELTKLDDAQFLDFNISPDGESLVIAYNKVSGQPEPDLYIYDISKSKLKPLQGFGVLNPISAGDTSYVHISGINPLWSPDGNYIAYGHVTFPSLGYMDNYIYSFKNNTFKTVEFNTDHDLLEQWSSDSKNLIFRKFRNTSYRGKFITNLDGGSSSRITSEFGIFNTENSVNQVYRTADNEIQVVNAGNGEVDFSYPLEIDSLEVANLVKFVNQDELLINAIVNSENSSENEALYLFDLRTVSLRLLVETDGSEFRINYSDYYRPGL